MMESNGKQIIEGGCYQPSPFKEPQFSRRWLAVIVVVLLAVLAFVLFRRLWKG
jgi:hypothetical protein